jgi:hypothetical protein
MLEAATMRRPPRPIVPLALLLLTFTLTLSAHASILPGSRPSSTNNDDTCDIAVMPAATLLLPYFEVEVNKPTTRAESTVFTIVNTVREPQIAHVTLWTDWGFPVLTYNLFLTGYDVESVNLYDVIVKGFVVQQTLAAKSPGSRSLANGANPNFLPSALEACAHGPATIPSALLADVRAALTTGISSMCADRAVGGQHTNATGYVTIDLAATCTFRSPAEPAYYDELLYDNVLTGDYQHITPNPETGNYAGGEALVHIRAVPEGGPAGGNVATALPYTFYDLHTPAGARRKDRRQPLPSAFAAHFVEGGPTSFRTNMQIWREPAAGRANACAAVDSAVMNFPEIVRFDERENPLALDESISLPRLLPGLPAAARVSTSDAIFPPAIPGEVAGWLYLNLNNGGSASYSAAAGRDLVSGSSTTAGPRQSQNWVTVAMFAESRYSVLFDATMLGNGCSIAPAGPMSATSPIGPAVNDTP